MFTALPKRSDSIFDTFETPAGWCTLAVRAGKVRLLEFGRGRSDAVSPFRGVIIDWFSGGDLGALPLDLSWATPFERAVYRVVRRIPRGKVMTYGEVAEKAGSPGAARAVGGAMGRNHVCLAIP